MLQPQRNVYHSGAQDGLIMGGLYAAVFLCMVGGVKLQSDLLSLLGLVLAVPGVVYLAFRLLERRYREEKCLSHLSAIWMHGIIMSICGCLIMGIVAYAFLRFVDPGFIADQTREVANMYYSLNTAEGDRMGHAFENMISRHLLPSPIAFAFSLMWLGSFMGAILSLILAIIIKATIKYKFFN